MGDESNIDMIRRLYDERQEGWRYEKDTWVDFDQWYKQNQNNNITLRGGGEEMLRVAEDGFYVRGVKVEQGPGEAEVVYKAFKEFMTWAIISKPE